MTNDAPFIPFTSVFGVQFIPISIAEHVKMRLPFLSNKKAYLSTATGNALQYFCLLLTLLVYCVIASVKQGSTSSSF